MGRGRGDATPASPFKFPPLHRGRYQTIGVLTAERGIQGVRRCALDHLRNPELLPPSGYPLKDKHEPTSILELPPETERTPSSMLP
jgi:hypothetical protein